MPLTSIIFIFFAGGVGAVLRYTISTTLPLYGTLCVNSIACFIMGYVINANFASIWLTAGLLGGLSTFSTFMAEAVMLYQQGKIMMAFAYILTSVVLGMILFYLGGRCANIYYS